MKTHKPLILLFILFFSVAQPTQAIAQENEPGPVVRVLAGTFVIGLLGTSTTLYAMRVGQRRKIKRLNKEIEELEQLSLLNSYMRGGDMDIREDLALGTDHALRDLADIMRILPANYNTWRLSLMAHQEMLEDTLNTHDTHAFYHMLDAHHQDATCALATSTRQTQGE